MFQRDKILVLSHFQETCTERNIKGCSSGRKGTVVDQDLNPYKEMMTLENRTIKVNKEVLKKFNCYKNN